MDIMSCNVNNAQTNAAFVLTGYNSDFVLLPKMLKLPKRFFIFFFILDGYVKTESVQIDFDSLKNQSRPQCDNNGDDYDDVGSVDSSSRYRISTLSKSA